MKPIKKHHVLSRAWPGRLICGRRRGQSPLVELDQADADPDLCGKCRKEIAWEKRLKEIAQAPKPGLQLWFEFTKEYF
jgi:hypothetical protein